MDFAYLDVYDLITTPHNHWNRPIPAIEASQLLWTGDDPINWDSVNWGSCELGFRQLGFCELGQRQLGFCQLGQRQLGRLGRVLNTLWMMHP